jgi:hypothetical protein
LVGKSEEKRSLGRNRRRWQDNIGMVIREIWWEVVNWIHLAHDRPVAGSCEHGNELSGSIKGGIFD